MQTILIYLFKVLICSGLLFTYYFIALRNKQFHYYNRFYLLFATIMSLMLPLLQIHLFTVTSSNEDAVSIMNVIYAAGEEEPTAVFAAQNTIPYNTIILILAVLFSLFFLLRLFLRIKKIYSIKNKYPVQKLEDIELVQTDLPEAPFSFLQNLFWRNDISLNDNCGRQILQHEITHIKEKHTWDKLFMQLLLCICWVNPFYWLIQKELSLIHEFIADEKSVKNKDASAFAAMLLTAQYGNKIFLPANPFFYSPIKRRLLMLTQSKKAGYTYLRRIMALPLIILVIALFAFRMQKETPLLLPPDKTFTLVVDAGHGGDDGGAVAANGTLEKTITLDIAKKIKTFAADYGITVLLTRETDITMTPAEKVNWIAAQKADACISIHANTSEKNSVNNNGMEVVISNNNENGLLEKSKILGSSIIQKLAGTYKILPALVQKNTGVWILKSNTLPAAIIECGYITNTADLQMMTTDEQVEKIARKILEGVALYGSKKDVTLNKSAPQPYVKLDTNKTGIYGYYEGKAVKGVEVSSRLDLVTLSFNDKSKKTISMDEARKNKILIPPPPPPSGKPNVQAENKSIILNEIPITLTDDNGEVKGTVSVNANVNLKDTNAKQPIILLNGEVISMQELKLNVIPENIESISVLKDEPAIIKYGEKAANGAVEITTKTNINLNIHVEKTPATFPGGEAAWKKYLEQNTSAAFMQKQGAPPGKYTIIVSFVVEKDGSITNAEALNDPGYGTAVKAADVIKQSPHWVPAVQDDKHVATKMKQPIVFIVPEKS